jgi:uncharacterized OB-fold protein
MPSARVLPELTPENAFFWTGGAAGELRILRCSACRTWIHPPSPICPHCRSRELAPEVASGRGTLLTWTVHHQRWGALPVPYVIAIVELDEQAGLRLLTNLVDVPEGRLRSGLRVAVRFESVEDVWLPLFAPEQP